MEIGEILKGQYEQGHAILQGVMADVDAGLVNETSGLGTLGSAGSIFAHMVFTEDAIISNARGARPVFETSGWNKRIGIESPGLRQSAEWAANAKLELPIFQEFAKEVFETTEKYVSTLTGADMDREIEGLGGNKVKLALMVATVGTIHICEHTGEIAAIKGVKGLKGLPF
ncbi:MAG: hypothetical protein AB7N24_13620 [Dehalococcoidia bacterium]